MPDSLSESAVPDRGEEDVLDRGGSVTRAERVRRPTVDDRSPMEQDDLVTGSACEMKILRREQDAAASVCNRRYRFAQHDNGLGVQGGSRLIDEDEWWRKREGGDSAHLSPKTARERPETLVEAIVEAESRDEHVGPICRLLARVPESADERDELRHRQFVEARWLVGHESRGCSRRPRSCRLSNDTNRSRIDRDEPRDCTE